MGVVIDAPARNETLQIGGEAIQRQAGDEIGQIERMGADIPGGPTRTGFGRIGAPVGLFLPRGLQRFGQPVLRIFHLHKADVAKRARTHHGLGLADHRVAGVIVGQSEDHAGSLGSFCQLFRLGQGGGQRFVADHMDAAFDKLHRHRRVHVVGGDDGHHLDAVFAAGLA